MTIGKMLIDSAIRMNKKAILAFLDANERKLLRLFREEMELLDDRMPDEEAYIDIKLGPLGEEIIRAALMALRRFIREY